MDNLHSNAEITALARQSLQNKWLKSAALFFALILIPDILEYLIDVFCLALPVPLAFYSVITIACFFDLVDFAVMTISVIWILTLVKESRWEFPSEKKWLNKVGSIIGGYLLMNLFIFLWTLLLIIPGIIASLNYSMTIFILADDPSVPVAEALRLSKKMMYGYRWKLVCLNFRFFGWILLSILTLGIGFFFVAPYMAAANAHFYRELKAKYEAENAPISYPGYDGMSMTNAILLALLAVVLRGCFYCI